MSSRKQSPNSQIKNSIFHIFLKDGGKCVVNSDKGFFHKDSGIARLENLSGSILTKNSGKMKVEGSLAFFKVDKRILYFPKRIRIEGCGERGFFLTAAAAIYNSKTGLIKAKNLYIKFDDGISAKASRGIIDIETQRIELEDATTKFCRQSCNLKSS